MRTVYVEAPGPKRPTEPLIEHEGKQYTRSAAASNYAEHYCVGGIFCTRQDGYLDAWKKINEEPDPVDSEAELIRRGVEARKRKPRGPLKIAGAYVPWFGWHDE